jgi:ABC-type Na+ transport system ATPase subunit NatA
VVFSSHILEDVEAVSDRVLLLREGSLVGDASVADLRAVRGGASVSEELLRRLGAEGPR